MSSTPTGWNITVRGGLDAPRRARQALSGNLDGELDAERKADASLLLHELVANSVLHAGADTSQEIGVRVRIDDATVRITVTDNGSVSIPSVRAHDAARAGGRGLRLVEELSDAWGMQRDGVRGTTMWFEMRRERPAPT